mmetsp:Transcript_11863/g.31333  ORF Transcript_11863/g.31333 Transcript_11863/m.31333 type:complete len:281 (-) Transcript_11863:1081-1923(-)
MDSGAALVRRRRDPQLREGAHRRRAAKRTRVHKERAVDERPRGGARDRGEDAQVGRLGVEEVQRCCPCLRHLRRVARDHREEATLLEEQAQSLVDFFLLRPQHEARPEHRAQRVRRGDAHLQPVDLDVGRVRQELHPEVRQLAAGAGECRLIAERHVQRRLRQRVEAHDLIEGGHQEHLCRRARAAQRRQAPRQERQHVVRVDLLEAAGLILVGEHCVSGGDLRVVGVEEGAQQNKNLRHFARSVLEGLLQWRVVEAVPQAVRPGEDHHVERAAQPSRGR